MKNALVIAALMLLTGTALGDKVLYVEMDVYKDDTVKVISVKAMDGYATAYIPEGKYKLEIGDSKGNVLKSISIDPLFILLTDPPVERDHATIALRIDYSEEMKTLSLYNADKKIYSGPIDACNDNGICETDHESYLSCPRDCPLDKKDGLCVSDADGICDPDCLSGLDSDCNTPKEQDPCNRDGVCDSFAGENATNCLEDCSAPSVNKDCVTEGDSIDTSGTQQCCAGLSAISCNRPNANGNCPDALCDSFVCAKCGDRVCGGGENKCNCPADCIVSSTTSLGSTEKTSATQATTTMPSAPKPPSNPDILGTLPYIAALLLALIIAAYLIYKRKS